MKTGAELFISGLGNQRPASAVRRLHFKDRNKAMHKVKLLWFAMVLLLVAAPLRGEDKSGNAVAGNWLGTLDLGAASLQIGFRISVDPSGKLAAQFDSYDQGAVGIPVDEIQVDGDELKLTVKLIKGEFSGKLNADKTECVGSWTQGQSLPLTMKQVDHLPEINRTQTPHKPYPYREEQVTINNKKAGVTLAGTLTLPNGDGPFPVAVMITGSGPQDRDESLLGHKPFLVIADYLTRRGFAVLRYDDRGVGKSTGDFQAATTLDFAADTRAVAAYCWQRKELDRKRIVLIGHSEGALIAPLVAANAGHVAAIVLLAGPAVNGEQIMYLQGELMARAMGADDVTVKRQRRLQMAIFDGIQAGLDEDAARAKVNAVFDDVVKQLASEDEKRVASQQRDAVMGSMWQLTRSPWFKVFLTYDPEPTLVKVKCPVLALYGEKDLQVPPQQNATLMEKSLNTAERKDRAVHVLPGLNHLFQTCKTGGVQEYASIPETFATAALDEIGAWLDEQIPR
jgi:pimeloyl-ACP methyl ester carboxylesterase